MVVYLQPYGLVSGLARVLYGTHVFILPLTGMCLELYYDVVLFFIVQPVQFMHTGSRTP